MSIATVLPELTTEGAERLSERIGTRLEAIATNYAAVLPLLREALARNAWGVLGYASPGAYAKDRWGETLAGLTPEMRREVSRELSAVGMSTRAIAPVLGVNNATVSRDLARVADATPDDEPPAPVVGIDGKKYNPVVTITTVTESFDASTGEAVDSPSPVVPIAAFLDVDQTFEDQKYVTAFVKAMSVKWTEFDPERIGRTADLDTLRQIDLSLESLVKWSETVKRSRPGLRVL